MCKKSECTTRKKETRILCLKENYTSCVKRIKTVKCRPFDSVNYSLSLKNTWFFKTRAAAILSKAPHILLSLLGLTYSGDRGDFNTLRFLNHKISSNQCDDIQSAHDQ